MTVLVTGASGNIGQKLCHHLERVGYELRRLDIDPRGDAGVIAADLSQWDASWVRYFEGVDTVIHLAGVPVAYHSWDVMIRPNMDAVVNVFTAAAQAGAKRIIFASSNHVMGGYRDNGTTGAIKPDMPPLPGLDISTDPVLNSTPYGAFKLAGERIGKCYVDIYGISFIGLRIGWIQRDDNSAEAMHQNERWGSEMWLSDRDLCQLVTCSIEADDTLSFAIFNGMSDNEHMRWDISSAREMIGYLPKDRLTR